VVDASGMGGFLRHDTFMADAGVQKVIAQAIADARSGSMDSAPSAVPVFQRDLPVTQAPLASVPAAPATVTAPATVSTPAAIPVPAANAPMPATTPPPAPAPASLY
jgi:hypothetical protein